MSFFGGSKPAAPAPLPVRREPPPPKDVDLRAQGAGARFAAGQVTETENQVDLLGNPAGLRRRSVSKALLG